ncbi:MAG: tetratricopeptide repeat protein, partial [Chloroflexota bacterium]
RREAGRYYLHPADKEYAFGLIGNGESGVGKSDSPRLPIPNVPIPDFRFTQQDLLNRAADFFAQARKPREEWKKLDDLAAQLAEFELRCEAGDYDTAVSVLKEIHFDCLLLWGHYRLMIDLHLRVKDKILDENLRMGNLNGLGLAYSDIRIEKEAVACFEIGLQIARREKNRGYEGVFLGNLGNVYSNLGEMQKAREYYEQALIIDREIGNKTGEGTELGNLGITFFLLGNLQKAIEHYEDALKIHQEVKDRYGQSRHLVNLGEVYYILGEPHKAIQHYQQALAIEYEVGHRLGISITLENLGDVLLSLNDYENAKKNYEQAIQIADEISFPETQNYARIAMAQTYLFSSDLTNARATIEAALQYDVPQYNHNATALHGIIALRQGEGETAQEAFAKSIAQADEILAKTPEYYSALDAKGLALCGAAIAADDGRRTVDGGRETTVNGQSSTVYRQQAIEAFKQARKIAPHAGVVKSVLRLFDELVKCDEEGVLKGVREVVAGVD